MWHYARFKYVTEGIAFINTSFGLRFLDLKFSTASQSFTLQTYHGFAIKFFALVRLIPTCIRLGSSNITSRQRFFLHSWRTHEPPLVVQLFTSILLKAIAFSPVTSSSLRAFRAPLFLLRLCSLLVQSPDFCTIKTLDVCNKPPGTLLARFLFHESLRVSYTVKLRYIW